MSNQNDHDREHDIREKIASQIQSSELVPRKELPAEELQKLQTATTRLDQLLNAAADADREALKTAASRLDQLLADIARGKDVTYALKRQHSPRNGKK